MAESKLKNLGAYELMQILHELHKLGYQKLRWMSYMAPTGLSLRCHITTQDHICANREIVFAGDTNVAITTSDNTRPIFFMDNLIYAH